MSTIVTRTGKGAPLTNLELDANFTNLNTDKYQSGASPSFTNVAITGTLTGGTGVVNLGSGQFYKDASGNIGLGTTSPTDSQGYGKFTDIVSTNGGASYFHATGTSTYGWLGYYNQNFTIGATGSSGIIFATGSIAPERMRLDASGNLGLGIGGALSPWAFPNTTVLQIRNAAIFGLLNRNDTTANLYIDGTGAARYIANGTATQFSQNTSGDFRWYVSPSGTAGNVATQTQAMTLDASGRLLVGTTTASGAKLEVGAATFGGYDTVGNGPGGGGGAGGFLTSTSFSIGASFTVPVGAGGAGATGAGTGTNGSNSVFSSITSTGGGGGIRIRQGG